MNPKDAFGNEITVGSKIIHSRQGYSHRHRLQSGTVTEVRATEKVYYPGMPYERRRTVGTVHYTDAQGHKRHAKRFDMVAVVG